MRILGLQILEDFKSKHADSRNQLDVWRLAVEAANWGTPQDIKNHYKSADFLPNNQVIFNIKGNKYRLVVQIRYANGMVAIEWVGTHAEYSKRSFK